MSKLKNGLIHMRNAEICVNGHVYTLDSEGTIEITDKIAISYLLQNDAWSRIVDRKPFLPVDINYSKMTKDEIITFLTYKGIKFDPKSKKDELVILAQQLQLGE